MQDRAALAYLAASLLTKGLSFITLPIYTRLLSTADMGVSTVFATWYAVLYAVCTLSLSSGSVSVAMSDYSENRDRYMSACLSLSSLSVILFGGIALLLHHKLEGITGVSDHLMHVMLCLLFFQPALEVWYARKRFEYQYKSVLAVSVLMSICSVFAGIVAVMVARNKMNDNLGEVRVTFQYAVIIAVSLLIYISIMRKGQCFFDKEIWKYALALSVPLVFHTLAKNILDVSDRLMIDAMCGKSYAGIYGTVYGISTAYIIIWTAINSSMIPMLFEDLKNRRYSNIDNRIWKALRLISMIAIISTALAPELLQLLTTAEYIEGVYIIPAVSAGIYFTVLYNVFSNFLMYAKKTFIIMFSTAIAAIVNLALNYLMIPRVGYIAAAYTTLFSYFVLAIMQIIGVKRYYKMSILKKKRMVMLSSGTFAGCLLFGFFYGSLVGRLLLLTCIITCVYLFRRIRNCL